MNINDALDLLKIYKYIDVTITNDAILEDCGIDMDDLSTENRVDIMGIRMNNEAAEELWTAAVGVPGGDVPGDVPKIPSDGGQQVFVIRDPYDENTSILVFFKNEATSESSADFSLMATDGTYWDFNHDNSKDNTKYVTFQVEIITDEDTGDSSVAFSNLEGPEEFLSVYGDNIRTAIENIGTELMKRIIGEPQVTTQQEI